jgi:protein phosphatase
LRDGSLRRLTEDDSLLEELIREGNLSEEDTGPLPPPNILLRALGVGEDLAVHEFRVDIEPGDRIVLCTDGLTGSVGESSIAEILSEEPRPQAACDELVDAANRAGGSDNITVIILQFLEADSGPRRRRPHGRRHEPYRIRRAK